MSIRGTRLLTVAVVTLMAAAVSAQDRYLAEMYGEGVHAIYRGNNSDASRTLTNAINGGFEDARAYYFRAITKMISGDSSGAETDIRMGAEQEVNGRGSYDVGFALQRFQGPNRVKFEKVRRDALIAAQKAKALRARSAPDNAYDRDYLREPADTPGPIDVIPEVPPAPGNDPFMDDDDAMEPVEETPAMDDDPADDISDAGMDDTEDPFADDAEDDPFADDMGEDMSEPDDMGGEEDPFTDDADDPFADDSGDDPFADDVGDDVSAEVDDMGDDLGDDPFADDSLESPTDDDDGDDLGLDSLFDE